LCAIWVQFPPHHVLETNSNYAVPATRGLVLHVQLFACMYLGVFGV